jgi:hypothetical protein
MRLMGCLMGTKRLSPRKPSGTPTFRSRKAVSNRSMKISASMRASIGQLCSDRRLIAPVGIVRMSFGIVCIVYVAGCDDHHSTFRWRRHGDRSGEAGCRARASARRPRIEPDPHQRDLGVTRQSHAAEPISLLYEKGRVLHRRGLDQLEAEMIAFSRMASETRSPCRKITKSKVASRWPW